MMKRTGGAPALLVLSLTFAVAAFAAEKHYGPGVTDQSIKIGQTMPYSGPASAYGIYGLTEEAYFKRLNETGGVNGRRIDLLSLDNAYAPPKALEGVRRLVEQEQVLALMGNFGTPTNVAVRDYLKKMGVPNLFLVSGASMLNDPKHYPGSIPLTPEYRTEGRIYAHFLLDRHPNAKIAILSQNDDLGRDYVAGLREGLGDRAQAMIVATATYDVTDATIDSQIVALQGSGADVLMEFVTPKFAAQGIAKVYALGWKPLHIIGLTGTADMSALHTTGMKAAGVITTGQKAPGDPAFADDPDVKAYRTLLANYYPNGDPDSNLGLVAYGAAQLYAEVLRQAGDDLTRAHLLAIATHLHGVRLAYLLPGVTLNLSPDNYDGLRQYQLTRYTGTRLEPLEALRSD